jgi:MFS family permease
MEMVEFLLFMVIFWPFFFLFAFAFSQIIYPLFYSLPLSIYYTFKKEIKARSIPTCLVAPIMWTCGLVGTGVIVGFVAAALGWQWVFYVFGHSAMMFAFYGAIIICLGKLILKKYRNDIRLEYYTKTYDHFMTDATRDSINDFSSRIETTDTDTLWSCYHNGTSSGPLTAVQKILVLGEISQRSNVSNGSAIDA